MIQDEKKNSRLRTKKAIGELESGHIMEVQATDKGSTADIQAWARSTGHLISGYA